MKRHSFTPRPDWQQKAEDRGFTFYNMHGEPYWDETGAYSFTLQELETKIEDPTDNLLQHCYSAVDHVCSEPALMYRMAIPEEYHQAIIDSWNNQQADLYGRFDLSYDSIGPAKMLEFNADTPTSLFESAVFQWQWLEDMIASGQLPEGSDQFNSIQETLLKAFELLYSRPDRQKTFHFGVVTDSDEDRLTVEYLADLAQQAGYATQVIDMQDIAVEESTSQLWDKQKNQIHNLFKLYPLELMVREPFGPHLITTPTQVFEPLWKLVLSNKGILPVLHDIFPKHENLLPAYFNHSDIPKGDLEQGWVKKPLLSREGANVTFYDAKGEAVLQTDGEYGEEGHVWQQRHDLPQFGDSYAVIGSWVAMGCACGVGIREDRSAITNNLSRFIPHFIEAEQ